MAQGMAGLEVNAPDDPHQDAPRRYFRAAGDAVGSGMTGSFVAGSITGGEKVTAGVTAPRKAKKRPVTSSRDGVGLRAPYDS